MKPTPGSLSPFQSSSSQHEDKNDNFLEHYVEGGEKVTDKTLDVDTSKTKSNAYDANVSTEPDAKSELAMQKEAGEGDYSTTANSRNNAPIAGATTEPDEIHKAAKCCDNACGKCTGPGCGCCADCPKLEKAAGSTCDSCGGKTCADCNKAMAMCKCSGMSKSDSEDSEDEEEDDDMIKKNFDSSKEIKKSVWGGAFIPL